MQPQSLSYCSCVLHIIALFALISPHATHREPLFLLPENINYCKSINETEMDYSMEDVENASSSNSAQQPEKTNKAPQRVEAGSVSKRYVKLP